MQRKLLSLIVLAGVIVFGFLLFRNSAVKDKLTDISETNIEDSLQGEANPEPHSLTIQSLREGDYPGSDLVVEQELTPGSNYSRYIVSYRTEGLKNFALLTIPNGEVPSGGWPAIVFNHGFIPPAEYRTTERYIAYTDAFSSNGYVLLRPDYRGHGNSEGEAVGGYGSNAYTIDVLNALSSLKKHPSVNPEKIGMWGHSMGGHITLRSMVVSKDIKAGVIWAGVVANYPDLINNWRRGTPRPTMPGARRGWRQALSEQFGTPQSNPDFWNSISSDHYLADVSGPIQLHHGTADYSVPVEFSRKLEEKMKAAGKTVEYYEYPGDDHDITANFGIASQRSVEFFDKYLK
jgi:uncharacterized protein